MSQEDALTLAARIKDEFSGPVREMSRAWKEFSDKLKFGHEESSKHAKEHAKHVGELRDKFKEMRGEVMEGVAPALEELGIGLFSVGSAIGAVIGNLKTAAEQFNVFKDASRRADTSADWLQSMSETLSTLTGESTDKAVQDLADMKEELDKINRGRFDTVNAWRHAYTGLWESLGSQLKNKTLPEALETTMEFFDKRPDIAIDKKREILSKLLGLDPRLATVLLKEFQEQRDRDEASHARTPYDPEAAERLDTAFNELRLTIREIGREFTHTFGADASTLMDNFAAQIKREIADVKALVQGFIDLRDYASGNAKADNPFFRLQHGTNEDYGKSGSDYGPTGKSGIYDKAYKDVPSFSEFMKNLLSSPVVGGHASPISFTTGGGEAESLFTRSVHSGTLAALQDWYAALSGKHGGIVPASYTPEGSGPGGLHSGGGYSVLSGSAGGPRRALAKHLGMDNAGSGATGDLPSGDVESAYLAKQRAAIFAKIDADPHLRDQVAATLGHEGNTKEQYQATLESLANRMAFKGTTDVMRELDSGFYGPRNRGEVGRANKGMLSGYDWAAAKVRRGSDIIGMRTDQGTWGSEVQQGVAGGVNVGGEGYADWPSHRGFGPAQAWRMKQEAAKAKYDRDLLANGAAAGMSGGVHKVEGDAHLKVDLNGFPKGTRTDLTYGGLFTQYTLARGRQMEESERQ